MGKREELLENIRLAKKALADYDKEQELLTASQEMRRVFESLTSQGFSEAQAMNLIVNTLKGVK